ncbi:ATP-dependent helicase [Vampirovibrio sp.]|uniref:ATP-dependent helicase n=1 Tax=Vampirovibrio sp. TaxID=2717857 RepID=UPI0035943FD4
MLYVEGPLGSGKTTRLIQETAHLLETRPASSVLVLCSNHARQQAFMARLLGGRQHAVAQLPIYTYAGFARNTLFNYWPLVEQEMAGVLKKGAAAIRPELSGLEDTELILKWLLARLRKEAEQKGQSVFENFPGSDQHILKQIVRRLRLRSENQLTRKDMLERSILLDEMCRPEVSWLEKQFDVESYTLRVLDPNKQLDIFSSLLKKDNAMSQWLKADVKHLVVDDVDETIVAQQRLIEYLSPTLETLILAADVDGGSRRGYLNAYPYDWSALKALRPGQTVALAREDAVYQAGQTLLTNWKSERDFQPMPALVSLDDRFITRVEMLEQVVEDILALLESGYGAGDFCVVLPKTDFISFYHLQSRLSQRGIPVQLLSGTKRPSDNPKCKGFISLIQWANAAQWKIYPTRWEIKTVLTHVLNFHQLPEISGEMLDQLSQSVHDWLGQSSEGFYPLPPTETLPFALSVFAQQRYHLLAQWLQKAATLGFDQQLYSAFKEILAQHSTPRDGYSDLNRIIQSYLRQRAIYEGLTEITGHQGVVAGDDFNRRWLEQVKSGTMADTPEMPEAIHPESVIIGTPQKMIDLEIYRKIQLWLDVGSREWARSDNAPLYNAWVHSAVWDGSTTAFGEGFNEAVIRTRAGHITRSLLLLAQERVKAYASELDDLGGAQVGLLKCRLLNKPEAVKDLHNLERATLRPDQAPVLDYRQGTMAISAVPGAGKTFVNVEMLLELIQRGIEPDRILVLTYMDSAAKTLLGRLKKKLFGISSKLPVVSTIHSLALRILTENDHAILAGFLPDDMTILDDYGRGDILLKVATLTQPESTKNLSDWQRAIDRGMSHCKMFGVTESAIQTQIQAMPGNFRLSEFLPAFQLYNHELHHSGSLDFTDLIIKAVEILRCFPDIREKYQQQFTYIIEDEAQDSSRLLQDFIALLGGETPNLIRTGDTNQSITTTFSSADTSVFREFVKNAALPVHMTHSGRCAPEIIDLANFWMESASGLPGLEQAFQPVKMLPVQGQNPELLYSPSAQLFELDKMEESWLVERILQIRADQPETAIAILVRTNSQVNRLTGLLHQAKIPAVSLSDQLNVNPIFSLIVTTLKLLATPSDLALQSRWYQLQVDAQLIPENQARKAWMESQPLIYQSPLTLTDEIVKQWHYDFLDFGRQAAGSNINGLVARMADRFCLSVADRSNGYLCALMAQDILNSFQHLVHLSPLEIVIQQFDAFQKSWRGKKSFGDVLSQNAHQVVQVMSMHKSKGQEFDVVFMPFLQAETFPHAADSIRFDEADKLLQELDRIDLKAAGQSLSDTYQLDKKREKIEEEARLVYVGLTRAKRALYLSAHTQAMTRYHKLRKMEPAMAFQVIKAQLHPMTDNVVAIREAQNAQAT